MDCSCSGCSHFGALSVACVVALYRGRNTHYEIAEVRDDEVKDSDSASTIHVTDCQSKEFCI